MTVHVFGSEGKNRIKAFGAIASIFLFASFTRFFGNNFDQGLFLHPDERTLIFVAQRIHLFNNLDPGFFNYGTLPVYILKGVAQFLHFFIRGDVNDFGSLIRIGRVLASLLDLATVGIVFLLARLLFVDKRIVYYSALFYVFSFFPLQNSNFFIVDNFVNYFTSLMFYVFLRYWLCPTKLKVITLALVTAALLASKITPVVFLPLLLLMFFLKKTKYPYFSRQCWEKSLGHAALFLLFFFAFHFLFMPYAYLSFNQFKNEIVQQIQMNNNPYAFPYTLLFVGTKPYLYYLENMFVWGVGPVISLFFLLGMVEIPGDMRNFLRQKVNIKTLIWIIYVFLNLYYFAIIGRSAVKFMRYMFLLYPFIAIVAGYGLGQISQRFLHSLRWRKFFVATVFALTFFWLVPFLTIYTRPHTRKIATEWIEKNIPAGATLATEHWDERLPCYSKVQYKYVELNLYDLPDNEAKWAQINEKIAQADYIIIGSQKLFVPLQRLDNCGKFQSCYPLAKKYYESLFSGRLGFALVAQFTSRPQLRFWGQKWELNDDNADESFSVYDHPRVYIFKKMSDPLGIYLSGRK